MQLTEATVVPINKIVRRNLSGRFSEENRIFPIY